MLIDPRNNKPFYIGKGKGNRVFSHINCSLYDSNQYNIKYSIINEIKNSGLMVEHKIVRHGLTEIESFQIEASLIDFANYFGFNLSNLVSGHHSIEKGLMTTEQIIGKNNADKLDNIQNNCVIINLNKKYKRGSGSQGLYDATKGIWAIDYRKLVNKDGSLKINYVLSEYKGLIVEVFEVKRWLKTERPYNSSSKKSGDIRIGVSFDGIVANEEQRNKYINKSISHWKKKGSATAHRFSLK
jgi:hypothetical protein